MSGLWSPEEESLHINIIELRAIRLCLGLTRLRTCKSVAVFSDNITALACLAKKGESHSISRNAETKRTLTLGRNIFYQNPHPASQGVLQLVGGLSQ